MPQWKPRYLRWDLHPALPAADDLGRQLNASPLVAQVLHNRGVLGLDAARAFLDPQLNHLHDPADLPGAAAAARRIADAVRQGRRIVVYGDYDVDGMTSVAILHACLKLCGASADFYVPHRLDEGYGLNAQAVAQLAGQGYELLITVDCGIGACQEVADARAAGMEVIVTDHHLPGEQLPPADAIVHPRLGDGSYPNPELCGAGVAFKLAWQVAREVCGNHRVDEPMRDFLLDATCLAALGTIADVVPLVGENRVIAYHGLRGLPATRHPGLMALLESADLAGCPLDAFDVGFRLAPRLNACGRMGHARQAVELLTVAGPERARQIAAHLQQLNTQRQEVERQIAQEAVEMVQARGMDRPDVPVIVLGSENWHGGVIGIVASRLVDRFAKPAVLVCFAEDGTGQGSGRSVAGFHLCDALGACDAHLLGSGGHAMAAGLRMRREQFEPFAEALGRYAADHAPCEGPSCLLADAETTLPALTYRTAEHLARLAPHGQGNPEPLLIVRGCRVINPPRRMGRSGSTAGMVLGQGSTSLRAVGFGMGDLADALVGIHQIDVACRPVLNTFNGRTSLELQLIDVLCI